MLSPQERLVNKAYSCVRTRKLSSDNEKMSFSAPAELNGIKIFGVIFIKTKNVPALDCVLSRLIEIILSVTLRSSYVLFFATNIGEDAENRRC